jgi:hypothetical protein
VTCPRPPPRVRVQARQSCRITLINSVKRGSAALRRVARSAPRSGLRASRGRVDSERLAGCPGGSFPLYASSGTPPFTDGPFIESKEHLGGFAVVDVADEEAARLWAGKIAVACGWPQEVRRFRVPMQLPETS